MKYLIELGQNFIESFRITESQKKIGEEFQNSKIRSLPKTVDFATPDGPGCTYMRTGLLPCRACGRRKWLVVTKQLQRRIHPVRKSLAGHSSSTERRDRTEPDRGWPGFHRRAGSILYRGPDGRPSSWALAGRLRNSCGHLKFCCQRCNWCSCGALRVVGRNLWISAWSPVTPSMVDPSGRIEPETTCQPLGLIRY